MICITTFIISSFLGIFFAKYRQLAKESFKCIFQKAKTGECEADLDTKLKSTLISKAMEKDKRIARFLNNYIEYISWALLVVFIISTMYAAFGIYSYLKFGNCAGPGATTGCSLETASNLVKNTTT